MTAIEGRVDNLPLLDLQVKFQSASMIPESSELQQFRFDWSLLPLVTDGLAGTGGLTFLEPEDFVVSELPSHEPSGDGEFAYAYVEKRNLNTHDLVSSLRERGVPHNEIGIAGLKDKFAVTRQWFSVPVRFSADLEALDQMDGVKVLEISRHAERLRRGRLRGNRFEVRVRQPIADWRERANHIVARLEKSGLPNYFGPQRFGRFNSNAIDGVRMIRGEKVPGGRGLNQFFISALQAHLFNWNLKARIESGVYEQVLTGDRARRHDTGGMFLVGDGEAESERARRLEISAVLPLYGRKVAGGLESAARHEDAILERFGLRRSDFRPHSRGAWRISRVVPEDVAVRPCPEGFFVEFTLPAGAYATTFLRDLTKSTQEEDSSDAIIAGAAQ